MPRLYNTVHRDDELICADAKFTEAMRRISEDLSFPLLDDPNTSQRAAIIGMFVLRPAYDGWQAPLFDASGHQTIFDSKQWIYCLKDFSGGGMIAGGNLMDAFRLGMQYGLSDAVITGSGTTLSDGLPGEDGSRGYLWMPYECANWPHVKQALPDMNELIAEQRGAFQEQGYLSARRYPAQMTISRSGNPSSPDLLSASMFHEKLPDGEPIEAYIVTTELGAERIRARAAEFGLEERINDILIIQSDPQQPAELDLKTLPQRLYRDYDIKIVNHDGGAMVMQAFCEAGIMTQLNFTFCRQHSVREEIKRSAMIPEAQKPVLLNDLPAQLQPVFTTADGDLPEGLKIAHMIQDTDDEAVIATLDVRNALI